MLRQRSAAPIGASIRRASRQSCRMSGAGAVAGCCRRTGAGCFFAFTGRGPVSATVLREGGFGLFCTVVLGLGGCAARRAGRGASGCPARRSVDGTRSVDGARSVDRSADTGAGAVFDGVEPGRCSVSASSSRGAAWRGSGQVGIGAGGRSAAGASSAGRAGEAGAVVWGTATQPLVRRAARRRSVVRRGCMVLTLPESVRGWGMAWP